MASVRSVTCIVALALLASACAGSSGSRGASAAPPPGGRTSVLLAPEIGASPAGEGSLLDAVRYLRPAYLTARGGGDRGGTVEQVQVSIDNGPPGPLSLVEDMRASAVASVALLTPSEVTQRFGMRDSFGPVLLVTLKRR